MFEGPPKNPQNNLDSQNESGPDKAYEDILATAESLKKQGINLFGSDDARVVELWDIFEDWEQNCDLATLGAQTVEKANNIVKGALVWVNAGYTEEEIVKASMERLMVEKIHIKEHTDNPEIQKIIDDAMEKLEKMLEAVPLVIERKIKEAQERETAGALIDAIPILTNILLSTRFKKFLEKNPEKKTEITILRDSIRERWKNQK